MLSYFRNLSYSTHVNLKTPRPQVLNTLKASELTIKNKIFKTMNGQPNICIFVTHMHSAHMVKILAPTKYIFRSFMRCVATCAGALYALFIMYV